MVDGDSNGAITASAAHANPETSLAGRDNTFVVVQGNTELFSRRCKRREAGARGRQQQQRQDTVGLPLIGILELGFSS